MSISFNSVPNTRVPLFYAEFDSSKSAQGPALEKFSALIIGQKLAAGTGTKETLYPISSDEQAITLFGNGSQITEMIKKFRNANKITTLYAIALDDDAAGVLAEGSVLFSGAATESGSLAFYVGAKKYSIAVSATDSAAAVVTAMAAAINADPARLVDATADTVTLNIAARNKGIEGNSIDLRFNLNSEDKTPAGLGHVITAMASGATSPSVQLAIDVMGEKQFKVIVMPYTDSTNLTAMKDELDDRFGAIRQNDGLVFTAKKDSYANLLTFGGTRNSKLETVMAVSGPSVPYLWASVYAAVAALSLEIDPARPLQTLSLPGIVAGNASERFQWQERDALLNNGLATHTVSDDGTVRIERAISTYQTNDAGADDVSYLDINTFFTLSYLRFTFRTMVLNKYPRHKLANDGTRFAPGQAVVTPNTFRAELVALFRQWETLGLVEEADQFINDLIVERNISDRNRLDVLASPDLINQLRVVGAQIAFLL